MSDADDRPGAEFDALPEDGDEFASLAEAASEIALGPDFSDFTQPTIEFVLKMPRAR